MSFKFVAFAALIAVARAGHLGYAGAPAVATYAAPAVASYAAPAVATYAAPSVAAYSAPAVAYAAPVARTVIAEPSAPAHYDFGYSVSDPHTGDHKSQVETRRGDVVQGSYSLLDSDGTKRTVDYAADAHNGFNAVVRKEPVAVAVNTVAAAPAVVAHAAPAVVAHAAPAVAAYSAPAVVAHSAPAVAAYSAPAVAAYSAPAVAAYSAPAVAAYSAPAVAAYSAPAVAAYSAPTVVAHSSPAVAAYATRFAGPAVATTYAHAPAYSYNSIAAPVTYGAVGAPFLAKYH